METLDLTLNVLLILFLAAMLAGFIDTLVGGGGLITIPVLLMCGVPPVLSLGTNKLQAVAGSGTASMIMFMRKRVRFVNVKELMVAAFIGSAIGSIIIQFINTDALNIIIPIVIVIIAVYFLLAPKRSKMVNKVSLSKKNYQNIVVPSIGFYDGILGPGTGSFFVLAGVSLRGQEIIEATAIAKTLNFATNIASLLVFVVFGKILWLVGGVMMVGQLIGSNLGARYLLKINPTALRYLLVIMSFTILVLWIFQEM